MSARVERTTPARYIKPKEIVVDFDPVRLKAPFLLRCGAMLIDYIILVAIPVISLLINRMSGSEPAKMFSNTIANTGWLIVVLLAATNFLLLPLLLGQSLGKILTGLNIVKKDGTAPSLGILCLRHLLGYPLTLLTLGLGFLFAVMNKRGRALHDYLAGTIVIYARKEPVRKESEDE